MENQTKDAENDETSTADVNAAETEAASSTSAFIAPVFNIVASAARSPFHALSLPDQPGRLAIARHGLGAALRVRLALTTH
jgi:hypothetical protein